MTSGCGLDYVTAGIECQQSALVAQGKIVLLEWEVEGVEKCPPSSLVLAVVTMVMSIPGVVHLVKVNLGR